MDLVIGCGEERAASRNPVKNQFSPVDIYRDFIFACKSASAPGDVSANAKTLRCTMFSDSASPKTLFFAMSSDSEVPGKGRLSTWKLVECVQIIIF